MTNHLSELIRPTQDDCSSIQGKKTLISLMSRAIRNLRGANIMFVDSVVPSDTKTE